MSKDTPFKRHGIGYEYFCQIEGLEENLENIKKIKEYLGNIENLIQSLIEYFSEEEDKYNEEGQESDDYSNFDKLDGIFSKMEQGIKIMRSRLKI